jgi:uncharacterized membrane protein YfcA
MASPGIGNFNYLRWGALPLLNTLLTVLIGITFGLLAGLGVGGGTLLILWLTLLVGMDQNTARAVNLMFFLAAAGCITILRWRKGDLNLKNILPAMISGCVAAGLCAWLGTRMEQGILRKFFGILLLVTGVRELLYRPRKAR